MCDRNHDDCTPHPCENGGTCQVYIIMCVCVCVCVVCVCVCVVSVCVVSVCVSLSQDLVGGYVCECEMGWTGDRCQIDIDDCVPIPCQNGGTCFVSFRISNHSGCRSTNYQCPVGQGEWV